MQLKNTKASYGWVTILLHWLMAVVITGLYFLGDYMVELDYYDSYYHLAPWMHKSIGLMLLLMLLFRTVWKATTVTPQPLESLKKIEIKLSKTVHILLYALIFVICISGYLISTANGAAIEVFNWFEIPALISEGQIQADTAGTVHELSTNALMVLALAHALVALKHHFIAKDKTLIRMLKP